jgi:type IV pilus assembly protein PilQ
MKRAIVIAWLGLGISAAATPRLAAVPTVPPPHAGSGDVTAVSVLPSPGRAEVVIDVRGSVQVADFVLRSPDRLVLDLSGAHLIAPSMRYDGVARAGIRDIRYAQFAPDVVRVVVQLDQPRDYEVSQDSAGVHVTFAARQPFAAWSSDLARRDAAPLPAAIPAAAPQPAPDAAAAPERDATPEVAAAAEAPPQASQQPRISVTFDRATIQEVIANFAAFSGRSIIAGKDVTGTVTAEIKDQPWDVAFYAILAGQGLAATELPGGIIRVDSRQNLVAQDSLEGLATRIVKVNYAKASSLAPSVAAMVSKRGKVAADTTTNSLIVTDIASRVDTVEAFVRSLDLRTPQVGIEAKIIFVNRTDLDALGLRYDLGNRNPYGSFYNTIIARPNFAQDTTGATPYQRQTTPLVVNLAGPSVAAVANASATVTDPALSVLYSVIVGKYNLTAFLDAVHSVGLSDVQAEPQVTVADNRPAEMWVGQKTPIRQIDVASAGAAGGGAAVAVTNFVETGIRLQVTPHIVRSTREVFMEIHAENSGLQATQFTDIPFTVNTQTGDTQLLVGDGETAVIGGLTVTQLTSTHSGIPILMDVPVIGKLFSFNQVQQTRQDLLILVTPHIIDDVSAGATGSR